MALNLHNPVTENLSTDLLAGPGDDCQGWRTGYEVIVADDRYALLPLSSDVKAKIGEEVQIDSMGPLKRGTVVRVLSGTQETYTDQTLIEATDQAYQVRELSFRNNHVHERYLTVKKSYPI